MNIMKKQNSCHGKSDLPQLRKLKYDDFTILIPNTKYLFVAMTTKITTDSFQIVQVYKQILVLRTLADLFIWTSDDLIFVLGKA